MILDQFHSAVKTWFLRHFHAPSSIQEMSWPLIADQRNTLIAAPTGSGKTLAAFLAIIDRLIKDQLSGVVTSSTKVIYVSPLKALSNDIEKNLQAPLQGISEELRQQGVDISIKVAVRTGDTTPAERQAITKTTPEIIVTTPESLYLLLTSVNGRKVLSTVETVIVDEIHALIGSKRGSHLSLSIERLEALTGKPLTRIGISATQKPMEKVAEYLKGSKGRTCHIVDSGFRRQMELRLEVPDSPLAPVMANEVWGEVYDRLEELINQHKTTLIFVNTRRVAERVAHNLTERLGDEVVTAHHGSMSKEHRLEAEQKLKAGQLKALVATASLELGIDIGSVDLVCQIGSPKSIAAFLQRVGRSGHSLYGTPKGIIFPLSLDELVECTALLDAVRRNELDEIIMPEKPVDILAQQIVAEVGLQEWDEEELFEMVKKAYPFRDISQKEYEEIIHMLAEGFATRKGRRGAYIHHDVINKKIRGRKNARLTALTSGGAIPDNFDYDVIKDPENIFIGTLNEDFAIESLPGDVFQLGNTSYRILRVENGKVRVEDAGGLPPSMPFWLGEGPGRTKELSYAVSRLRAEIDRRISFIPDLQTEEEQGEAWKQEAMDFLTNEVGIYAPAADQLIIYLATAKAALGLIPNQETLLMERFFDEAGDMHLVIHSPFGSRLNRGWGLSLRKKFCRKFNFELQAAATEDAIILSLGATHSFAINEVYNYLKSASVRQVLIQALLDSPMFEIRWRWNASRALAVLRRRAGQKVPAQIQRMNSEDLVAQVFPDQLACLENISGEREVPDHPLVNQTIHDCLTEAMDIEELEKLLQKIEAGQLRLEAKDLTEPSPLAQEILNARPYYFLDDAPLEERRTRAVVSRRWTHPSEASELAQLDERAIELVKQEVWPQPQSADEFHDALSLMGYMTEQEVGNEAEGLWNLLLTTLIAENRAVNLQWKELKLTIASERIPQFKVLYPEAIFNPDIGHLLPDSLKNTEWAREKALVEIIRGRMEVSGPIVASKLAKDLDLPVSEIDFALMAFENEGFIFRGKFYGNTSEIEWCERRLLARIHRYTLERLRKETEPVGPADFMRFLFRWHRLEEGNQAEGQSGLVEVLKQLEGYESAAASWEGEILPARVKDYEHTWLDLSIMSGRFLWGRFRLGVANGKKKPVSPVKTTPLMLVSRANIHVWNDFFNENAEETFELSKHAQAVLTVLKEKGALFFDEIASYAKLFDSQVEESIAELVGSGLITSDSFSGLRALLVPSKYKVNGSRNKAPFTMDQAGRWSLIVKEKTDEKKEKEYLETIARGLLKRYGVVFRKLADHETFAPPWRELVRIYRSMEARGEIRGGRFVEGVWGEQFALPEVIPLLRSVKKEEKKGMLITISATDPLNLTGIITPGKKIPSFTGNRILYKDGVVEATFESGEVVYAKESEGPEKWKIRDALVQRRISPKLRPYLGKGIV